MPGFQKLYESDVRKGDDVAVIDQGRKSKEAWATLKFRCQQLTKKEKKTCFLAKKSILLLFLSFLFVPKRTKKFKSLDEFVLGWDDKVTTSDYAK